MVQNTVPYHPKMKKWYLFLAIFLVSESQAQEIEVIKFHQLESLIQRPTGQIRIFNFWATWCKPCLEELPYFETVTQNYDPSEVKVYLISLDFKSHLDSKLRPFINSMGIKSEVKLLDETDFNSFIDKIDPRWSGAIPVTLVLNRDGQKHFFEKQFREGELEQIIKQVTN